ncbi:hypothetical protein NESM_000841500 [Novymonas esmeraldas]|uniref:Uncharacterized protein n=1 Tax=Novymonas esmeraldas TaxID=1808958 RepID=A0AAW0EY31_9TRYP
MASSASAGMAVQPRTTIAFFTSADRRHCLVGVVASTPTTICSDGSAAVLVQPRPLILLLPTPTSPDTRHAEARVVGHLVGTSDPAVAQLASAPIPSPRRAAGSGGAVPPLSADDVTSVMTAEELRVMREHRDGLQTDLDSSNARMHEISELLRHNAQLPSSAAAASSLLRAPSPLKAHFDAARRSAEEAAKAADAAEKDLLLARAGLRTVKPLYWVDLQRRRSGSSSQLLVSLVEAAAALLRDRGCAAFDDVVVQAATLPKRLAAVKATAVSANEVQRATRFLQAWPDRAALESEHKTAAVLYRWVDALAKAAQAQRLLRAAQQVATSAAASPGSSEPAPSPRPTAKKLGPAAEAALQKELKDHQEYAQMAEEELSAIDALIGGAEALAASTPRHDADTVVPALVVPASWVACTLPDEEEGAAWVTSYASQPRDTVVELSRGASATLSPLMRSLAPSVAAPTAAPPAAPVAPPPPLAEAHLQPPSPGAATDAATRRAEEAEEKSRLLEARLAAALQLHPRVAEVQLLRDELDAKRVDLHRVLEERDRLLQERRDRGSRYARGEAAPAPGSGRLTRQPSTPRDTVDRSVAEELEEQLTAAHQRIAELMIETSERRQRRRSPTAPVVAAAPRAVSRSGRGASARVSILTSPSTDEFDSAAPSVGGTPLQRSPRGSAMSPGRPHPTAPTVSQETYEELQASLHAAAAELDSQRLAAHRLEEQLNEALHRRSEAERMVAAQQHELQEVWEKLEAAEARADEHEVLSRQRLLLAQTPLPPSAPSPLQQPQLPATLSSSSTMVNSHPSQTHQQQLPAAQASAPRFLARPTLSMHDVFMSGPTPSAGTVDADVKSQANDDATTVTASAHVGYGNASRLSTDVYPHSFATFSGAAAAAAAAALGTGERSSASPYSRGPSTLQSRPVEQLTTIELRHEVHRLREEVERHQSGELRTAMELQTLRAKQKADHKRRREARMACIQMLTRMQGSIDDIMERSTTELEAIPALLERSRVDAEARLAKRRMAR